MVKPIDKDSPNPSNVGEWEPHPPPNPFLVSSIDEVFKAAPLSGKLPSPHHAQEVPFQLFDFLTF